MGADVKFKSYLTGTRFFQPRLLILGLVLTLLQSQVVVAEAAIVVVVRKDSPLLQLSRDEVVALFLGKTRRSNDIPLTPFDSKDNALRDRFYLEVAEMSGMRVKAYWSRIVFSGQGRPPQEVSASEARTKLADESDALIYLPADQVAPDMKVVFSMP
jgi:hypothetical protein